MRSLSEQERADYEASFLNPKKGDLQVSTLKLAKVRLIILGLVDADGNPIFRDAQAPELMLLDSAITNNIYDQLRAFIGFDDGDIEGLVKNSETTTGDD